MYVCVYMCVQLPWSRRGQQILSGTWVTDNYDNSQVLCKSNKHPITEPFLYHINIILMIAENQKQMGTWIQTFHDSTTIMWATK